MTAAAETCRSQAGIQIPAMTSGSANRHRTNLAGGASGGHNMGMTHPDEPRRPSKISIPGFGAHPMARLVFQLMRDTGTSYDELAHHSGLQRTTVKSWRREKLGSLRGYEAALGCFAWRIIPCPPLDSLPAAVREKLDDISLHFRSDDEVLAAAIATFADGPRRADNGQPIANKSPDQRAEERWAA